LLKRKRKYRLSKEKEKLVVKRKKLDAPKKKTKVLFPKEI